MLRMGQWYGIVIFIYFYLDFFRVLKNCVLYNGKESEVGKVGLNI